ncbi:hypothetical protein AB0B66_18765 [Catellatospora sp. NPDC049111]|uniref:hypothetical protein n=1 Tax=Catellatospora sp. NPDC049111 TaxID=3155271 RepID=UPI0033F4CD22
MGKRVNIDGPGDSPDEYWFECDECEGDGTVNVPDDEDERYSVSGTCPVCDGLGCIQGDADDVDD